jgi:hypothetical protein
MSFLKKKGPVNTVDTDMERKTGVTEVNPTASGGFSGGQRFHSSNPYLRFLTRFSKITGSFHN